MDAEILIYDRFCPYSQLGLVVLAHKQRDYQPAPGVVAHGRGAGRSWPVQRLVGAEIWRFGLKDALVNPE